ncbi:hypothetical protein U1701_18260 [Sphingomonas sp. PB2P19]|uniref:hypothetical protein n=1 Tax=Sphingomonas rhamnosi TaxID=3096156 RepID=UPI002FC9B31F
MNSADDVIPSTSGDARTVADVRSRRKDANGDEIVKLYWRKPPDYAVYKTHDRGVLIHYADNRETALVQRRTLAPLTPLRDEVDGLIQGWRSAEGRGFFGLSNPDRLHHKADCADRRVAGALIQGLEEDVPGAQLLLEKIKGDILNERIAWARFEYLLTAFAAVLGVMFLAWLLAAILPPDASGTTEVASLSKRMFSAGLIVLALAVVITTGIAVADRRLLASGVAPPELHPGWRAGLLLAIVAIPITALLIWPATIATNPVDRDYEVALSMWRGSAAGAVGAFFSIALAIRGRTVLPDLLRTANMMDALLRVVIGAIAGTVLIALIAGDVVTFPFAGTITTLSTVIAGFIAGFAERLVPDLLEKVSEKAVEFDPETAVARVRQSQLANAVETAARERAVASPANGTPGDSLNDDADNDNINDNDLDAPKEGFVALDDDENTQDDELPLAIGGVARS